MHSNFQTVQPFVISLQRYGGCSFRDDCRCLTRPSVFTRREWLRVTGAKLGASKFHSAEGSAVDEVFVKAVVGAPHERRIDTVTLSTRESARQNGKSKDHRIRMGRVFIKFYHS